MPNYESTFILKGDMEEKEVGEVATSIKQWIEKEGGSLLSLDNWGKKRLAYRIKKQRYGNYLLARFELDATKTNALEWNFKLSEDIMKYLVIRISQKELEGAAVSTRTPSGENAGSNQGISTKPEEEE